MPTRGCNCFVPGSEVGSFGYYCPVFFPFFSIGGTSTERRCSSRFPTGLKQLRLTPLMVVVPVIRGKSEREKPSIDLKRRLAKEQVSWVNIKT